MSNQSATRDEDRARQKRTASEIPSDDAELPTPAEAAMQTWRGLNGFERDCLEALAVLEAGETRHDQPHGLGIKAYLEDQYGEEIPHGRVYYNMDRLVGEGLVTKEQADRRTNAYRVTDRGVSVLRAGAAGLRRAEAALDGGDG